MSPHSVATLTCKEMLTCPIARHFGHNNSLQFTLSSSRPQPYSHSSFHDSSTTTRNQSCLALLQVPSAPTPILSAAIDLNPIQCTKSSRRKNKTLLLLQQLAALSLELLLAFPMSLAAMPLQMRPPLSDRRPTPTATRLNTTLTEEPPSQLNRSSPAPTHTITGPHHFTKRRPIRSAV